MLDLVLMKKIVLEHLGKLSKVNIYYHRSLDLIFFLIDCSALELAISEYSLWLLTSCGEIQCRENISPTNPIGIRSTTLSGHFLSLTGLYYKKYYLYLYEYFFVFFKSQWMIVKYGHLIPNVIY